MPDYILTLVEQIGILLRELARARRGEKPQRLSAMFLRETGLPLDFARHSAPETILQLLRAGGGTQYFRAVVMAELLLEDAALNESAGKGREALVARAQARALIAHSIDHLSPEDQSVYKDKLDALTTELTRASP
jgi:hypothetical protein